MSVSPNWDVFFPHFETRAKLHKATGGLAGQMEGREYVFLNQWGRERGGGQWQKGEEGAVAVGVAVNMSNSAKITHTSAVHLECFQ